ncbi:Uncharacterised protein [Mycobacteroides abscessus subsp. abscessus]|nr:Uncharacterised protein [Mycobacteroides abscessus subsp. abscessus]
MIFFSGEIFQLFFFPPRDAMLASVRGDNGYTANFTFFLFWLAEKIGWLIK